MYTYMYVAMAWNEYKRTDSLKGARDEFISVRPLGIAFSSGFVVNHGLDEMSRVSVLIDDGARRVGFRFHTNERDIDSFSLTVDGTNSAGRWFQSKHLYTEFPWLAAVLKRPLHDRRFTPKRAQGVWFIEVA